MSLLTLLIISVAGTLLAWQAVAVSGRFGGLVAALLPAGLFAGLLTHLAAVLAGGRIIEKIDWAPSLGVNLSLQLDGFSLLFGLLITGIGALVTLYAGSYFADAAPRTRARFIFLILLFMTAMLGTVLSDNLVVMYVFWEWTSLTSFMLIGFETHIPEARSAALQSLLVTAMGGLALFGGILLLGFEAGTFSLSALSADPAALAQSPYLVAIVALVLLGAFTKSAQFPFHFWLPRAMQAPTPASAYLHSATMVKLGIYLLARFNGVFADVAAFGPILIGFGSLTMLFAAINALRATGYKAVLAHSTVASLGILVMLIGLDSAVAPTAVITFILAHALYKAALFFTAGTAIHATNQAELRQLGGLAQFLPFTAVAALLASLSLAGLPPSFGFIAKEYLFEAQLASSWVLLPVAVAVLTSAVLVGIAYNVSVRPYFQRRELIKGVRHEETPGLVAGPLVLGALGIILGLAPGLLAGPLVQSAASAISTAPVEVTLALWHGLTPMLLLSGLVISLGALLAWQWDRLQAALRSRAWTAVFDSDRGYHWVLDGILAFAGRTTRVLQNGDQRRYTLIVVSTVLLLSIWTMVRAPLALASGGPLLLVPAVILLLAVIGSVTALRSRSLVAALIGVGVVGYGSALIFLLNGAPDLALTQFAVETLVLVVMMAVLVRLPFRAHRARVKRERVVDAGLAVVFAVLIFAGLASMLAQPFDSRLSDFYGQASLAEAHGRNVVNVIIVDFRGLDTLGEISVVAFATLSAWVLLRRRARRKDS